jgi:glycerol-3-phosphate dehydrogenase
VSRLTEPSEPFPNRAGTIRQITALKRCDLLIVGGGIHGTTLAHFAALHGLSTVLLEANDYASGCSSRSSKMLHGGLRYLEYGDFTQVFEGIKARDSLFETARHLCEPLPFLIPVHKRPFFKLKLGIGLKLYDLMLRAKARAHRFVKRDQDPLRALQPLLPPIDGAYLYYDGLMNDARIVIDTLIAARQEGAFCLNHASVEEVRSMSSEGGSLVLWRDHLTDTRHDIACGLVVNCAGAQATAAFRGIPESVAHSARFSRGSHLLFPDPWPYPAMLFPMAERGRAYFVWPHFTGTMVGTTERAIDTPEKDPLPSVDELDEICTRLAKDLPGANFDRKRAHYCFAGTRIMALKGGSSSRKTAALSRRHRWVFERGVLHLIGGKFTTAAWTAAEGMREIFKLAALKQPVVSFADRPLPGADHFEMRTAEFKASAEKYRVPQQLIDGAIRRLGGRVSDLIAGDDTFQQKMLTPVGARFLYGEIVIACDFEQAETLEDLMRRRLELEYDHDNGLSVLNEVATVFKECRPAVEIEPQIQAYKDRVKKIRELLNS